MAMLCYCYILHSIRQPPTIVVKMPQQPPPVEVVRRPVRAVTPEVRYQQVGYLQQGRLRYPLYGKPSLTNRGRFRYYTVDWNGIVLPITYKDRDCTLDLGCEELYDKDVIEVPGVSGEFVVFLYSRDFR